MYTAINSPNIFIFSFQMAATDSSVMLQPGQIIRPQTTEENARELIQELYGMTVTWLKELVSYDDRNYWVKVDAQHSNPNVKATCEDGYILKVLNSMDSLKQHVGKCYVQQ